MRLIVAGGREYRDPRILHAALAACPWTPAVEEIIEGGAEGVDALAAAWAREHGKRHTRVVADWKKFGRAAGPRRNRTMAELGDALLAIPGNGRGTYSMIEAAKAMDLPIFVFEVNAEATAAPSPTSGSQVAR